MIAPAWSGPLGDALALVIDHRGKTPKKLGGDWTESGVPVLSAMHVKGGRVDAAEARCISEEMHDRWMPERLCAGDVLLTSEAPLGEAAYLRHEIGACLGQRLYGLRADEEVLHSRFLYFLLRDPSMQAKLAAHATGTTVLGIRQSALVKVEVDLPDVQYQRQVASVLGSYDDLIENNRRRIEILEEMAGLVYREWFVHFRFPGQEDVELVDSDLAPIPEGWETETLADAAHLVMGQSPKSEYYNEVGQGLPFHQGVTNFGTRYPLHKTYCSQENRVAEEGDILLSVRAPVGRINVAPDRLVIGRGLAALRSRRDTQVYLFQTLREVFAKEDSMGGGTIFKAVTKRDLERIGLLRPPVHLVEDFENAVGPTFELVRNLTSQVRVLSEVRDLLLPRLISGELDVSGLDLDLEPVA
ncbi:MAG: restriction endonuclease subunit S [Actinomycetota bacterium]|nr:restriction endonuclease subunit S [Actinomycetota bacterium]